MAALLPFLVLPVVLLEDGFGPFALIEDHLGKHSSIFERLCQHSTINGCPNGIICDISTGRISTKSADIGFGSELIALTRFMNVSMLLLVQMDMKDMKGIGNLLFRAD
ncbi:hypothetical protein PV325_001287 [Microctonus aethiopoides]|nr:hypothetical protein PV325_001287 [Microctonus aethiopoides]